MRVKFKQAVVYAGLIAALFLTSLAYAQPVGDVPEGGAKRHRKEAIENLVQELNLTPEQQEQIKKQRNEQAQKTKALRNRLQAKRKQLREELEKQAVDKNKIDSLVVEIKSLMGQQLEHRVERVISMSEILTPEQFEKMKEKRKQKQRKMKQRRGQRGEFAYPDF